MGFQYDSFVVFYLVFKIIWMINKNISMTTLKSQNPNDESCLTIQGLNVQSPLPPRRTWFNVLDSWENKTGGFKTWMNEHRVKCNDEGEHYEIRVAFWMEKVGGKLSLPWEDGNTDTMNCNTLCLWVFGSQSHCEHGLGFRKIILLL